MAEYLTNTTDLTKVASAIREKGGTTVPLIYPDGFVTAIEGIETGGGISVTGHITQTIVFIPTTETGTITFPIDNIDLTKPFNAFGILLTDFFYKKDKVMGYYGMVWNGTNSNEFGGLRGATSWPYIDYYPQQGFTKCTPPNIVVKGESNFTFIPGEQYLLLIVQ